VRRVLSLFCAAAFTPQPKTVVAVTGTNGKTSVANFCHRLWINLGFPAAAMGTLGLQTTLDFVLSDSLTTPDPIALHQQLKALADQQNIQHVALEASSHGLDQYRLDGVSLHAAAWTNFTQDHLDYHKTFEAYFAAKSRLFLEVLKPGHLAVLGADLPESLEAACRTRGLKVLRIGRDLFMADLRPTPEGLQMVLSYQGQTAPLTLPLYGTFQAENVAAAVGLLLGCGHDFGDIVAALPHLRGVVGRMELVHRGDFSVFVDYAHTPDALEKALQNLRPHTTGRLIVVFGCGGNRDAGKRSLMGAIAHRLADRVYITDDNPRFEDPTLIRRAILASCPEAIEIGDRATAIHAALVEAKSGDTVIVAGKGHEQGQVVRDQTMPFSDHAVIRSFFGENVLTSVRHNF
jgi:UDP-N-acetylmuramoyl-L-alanyl-D-glutamate--2,6-diaminopimelate ligase